MIQGQNVYINLLLNLLSRKTFVPSDFHDRAAKVRQMMDCDSSGLVSSLSQFQVDCATIDLKIETDNDNLNDILNKKWLKKLNKQFRGYGIERGVRGLMREYYKERWQGASFPVLKILKWEEVDGMNLPISMVFVDGGSVYAKDKNNKSEELNLFNFDYFIGKNKIEKINPSSDNCLIFKPFSRWFVKYPAIYMISKGIYKNWKIIDMLKDKEMELVEQVIPYLFHIIKGDKELQLADDPVTYNSEDLKDVVDKMDELIQKMSSGQKTAPTKATNWDEQMKHLIPDMESMFKEALFVSAEKNILSGFGFIDIAEAVSNSRVASVLNPKPFIKEINTGITGFVCVVEDLLELIKEKNPGHPKFITADWNIIASNCSEFLNDKIATMLRSLRDRGLVSERTITDVLGFGYTNYETEKIRLEKEKVGKPKPNQIQDLKIIEEMKDLKTPEENLGNGVLCECLKCGHTMKSDKHCNTIKCPKCGASMRRKDRPGIGEPTIKKVKESDKITDDKKGAEKRNYNYSSLQLRGSPYTGIKELPDSIQKMTIRKQRKWMKIWNRVYQFYLKKKLTKKRAEKNAFLTANTIIKKVKD